MAPAEGNKADATTTASSSTAVAEETKKQLPQLGALEEDDEFEEVGAASAYLVYDTMS